jgi:hypothetical protein
VDPDRLGTNAEVHAAGAALTASAAADVRRDERALTLFQIHPITHRLDPARDLVAGDPDRAGRVGAVSAGGDAQIRPADAARADAQHRLSGSWSWRGPVLDSEITRPVIDERLH